MGEIIFTPGPWIARPDHVIEGPHAERGIWPVAEAAFRETTEEIDANARLIAAAPELYAALDKLTDQCCDDPALTDLVDNARAALAKAIGKSEVAHAL